VNVELGGLEAVKAWIRSRRDPARFAKVRKQYHLPALRGVMLCGVSGGGKSMLAQLIAKEFNLALLRLDVGALFASYVGESEQKTREALQLAEVLAPVVLWLDEVEKAFSGIKGSGDSGVSSRVFGTFLTWLSEKQDSVFVVATANDPDRILDDFPEFGRKGRFDEIFWVGLPNEAARVEIFRIKLKPLFDEKYLTTTREDLLELSQKFTKTKPSPFSFPLPVPSQEKVSEECKKLLLQNPTPADPRLVAFSLLLASEKLSGSMTGAEIEHAIKESLYDIYNHSLAITLGGKGGNAPQSLTGVEMAEKFVLKVYAASSQALYQTPSTKRTEMDKARENAKARGWPVIGD
jgi:SpoVK/Ycf46/Vps4 family AAA+-type ATPase